MQGFLLQNAWKNVQRNKVTSGLLIGICLISILASLAAGNLVWSLWRQYVSSYMTDPEQQYIAEFFVKEKEAEKPGNDMDAPLAGSDAGLDEDAVRALFRSKMGAQPDKLEFCSFLNMIVETDGGVAVCNVQGNTKNLTDFHRCSVIDGKGISAIYEQKGTCVIRAGGSLERKGSKVGDTLKINGHTFRVIGVVEYTSYGEVYLPYDAFSFLAGNQKRQYQAVLYYNERPKTSKVRGRLGTVLDFTEFSTGEEFQQIYLSSVLQRSFEKLIPAGMLFLFATINFYVLIGSKVMLEQKRIGIHFCVGASKHMVFLENFLESEMLVILAFAAGQGLYQAAAGRISGLDRFPSLIVSVLVFVVYSGLGLILTEIAVCRLFAKKRGLQLLKDME